MSIFVKNKKRGSVPRCLSGDGFTLIELLVVLAVIGLLAVIVIVSLGDSKDRGRDAAIKSSLLEVAKVAEDFAGNTGSYDGVCDPTNTTLSSDGNFGVLKATIEKQRGTVSCEDSDDGFVVACLIFEEVEFPDQLLGQIAAQKRAVSFDFADLEQLCAPAFVLGAIFPFLFFRRVVPAPLDFLPYLEAQVVRVDPAEGRAYHLGMPHHEF